MRQAIGDRLLNGRGHGAPRAPEQPSDLLPRQGSGPRRKRHHQRMGHLLAPPDPGQRLDMHAGALRAPQAPRRKRSVTGIPHSGTWRKRRGGRVSRYAPRVPHWPHRGKKRRSVASSATNPPVSPVTVTTRNPRKSTVALTRLSRSMSLLSEVPFHISYHHPEAFPFSGQLPMMLVDHAVHTATKYRRSSHIGRLLHRTPLGHVS